MQSMPRKLFPRAKNIFLRWNVVPFQTLVGGIVSTEYQIEPNVPMKTNTNTYEYEFAANAVDWLVNLQMTIAKHISQASVP